MVKLAVDGGTPVRTEGFGEWPIYGELEIQLLQEVLESGKWGGAGAVKSALYQAKLPEMEERFAEIHGAAYSVSVVNGTVAITAALQAVGLKAGDEVIIPPYTFIATASAPLAFGAIPVFVDIEANTLLLDPEKVEQAITPKTKAIIAVHIAGAPANMTRLGEIARKYKLALIEDAAQAVGAQWEGRGVGTLGDMATFSLQSGKNLNAGEGGIILTNNKSYYEEVWSISNLGRVFNGAWYQHDNLGQNYRMTEFQAAILLAQMIRLDEQMLRREANARLLDELLHDIEGISLLERDARITRHANHIYIFKLHAEWTNRIDKQDFIRMMNAEGIPVSAGYVPLNQNKAILKAIKQWSGEERYEDCPICDRLCEKEVLWLDQTVLLADENAMHDIAQGIRKVIQSYTRD